MMDIIDRFRVIVGKKDAPSAFAYAIANPVLLNSERWPEIESWIATLPAEQQSPLTGSLKVLKNLGQEIDEYPAGYPEDRGPIELLAAQVESNMISLHYAIELAATAEIAESLAPFYIRICAGRAHHRAMNGEWRAAMLRFRILLTALDAWQSIGKNEKLYVDVVGQWLAIASIFCHEIPDGHLFHDAARRGQATIAVVEQQNDHVSASHLHHLLGVLHLDTYISGRTSLNFKNQIKQWLAGLRDEYGAEAADDETRHMPEALEALSEAIHQFEQALLFRPEGQNRGLTLKALAEALYWQEIAGGMAEHERILATVKEALALLDPQKYPYHIETLKSMLQVLSKQDDTERRGDDDLVDTDLFWMDPKELAIHDSVQTVINRYLNAANLVRDSDSAHAIALLRRVIPLIFANESEEQKINAVNILVKTLSIHFDTIKVLESCDGDLERAVTFLEERSESMHWVPVKFAAALLALAGAATVSSHEESAIPITGRAIELFRANGSDFFGPARIMQMMLMIGSAVNSYNADDMCGATSHYVDALTLCVKNSLPQMALELLTRSEDTALQGDQKVYAPFLVGLAEYGPRLAAEGGGGVASRIHQSWMSLIAHIMQGPDILIEPVWFALQAAKGGAFAAMLQYGTAYNWRNDPDATHLLDMISEVRSKASNRHINVSSAILDDDFLTAYAGEAQSAGGKDTTEVLNNLEQSFDTHIARKLLGENSPGSALLNIEEAQNLLDERTVFLDQYIGRSSDGRLAYTGLVITRQSVNIVMGIAELPSATIIYNEKELTATMNWIAPLVSSLRTHIVEEPGPAEIVPEGADELSSHFGMFFGGNLPMQLDKLRATGKDHLCIHSHGPLHFYPQHLLGLNGCPLADEWIVTELPHPAMLRRLGESADTETRLPVTALGLGFMGKTVFNLLPLSGASDEALNAATVLGGKAWIDNDATKARFIEGLNGSKRVHLCTHGQLHVHAPAFQSLYLAPDHRSDGVFHAYEIIGLDLRHLDLLTLSACETALGRIDIGDSPRGLPASFFIAGVRTLIGCLWPVATDVAVLFFESLYNALSKSPSKLDAFYTAQRTTRRTFPAYRDWGSFHYAGLW